MAATSVALTDEAPCRTASPRRRAPGAGEPAAEVALPHRDPVPVSVTFAAGSASTWTAVTSAPASASRAVTAASSGRPVDAVRGDLGRRGVGEPDADRGAVLDVLERGRRHLHGAVGGADERERVLVPAAACAAGTRRARTARPCP